MWIGEYFGLRFTSPRSCGRVQGTCMRSRILLLSVQSAPPTQSCLTLSLWRFCLYLHHLHQGWVVGHRNLVYDNTFSFHQSLLDKSDLGVFIFVNVCAKFCGFFACVVNVYQQFQNTDIVPLYHFFFAVFPAIVCGNTHF